MTRLGRAWNQSAGRLAVVSLVLLLAGAGQARGMGGEAAFEPFDRWFVVQMAGDRVGFARMSQSLEGEQIVTAQHMRVAFKRGPTTMQIEVASSFRETRAGKPIEAETKMDIGAMQIVQSLRFEADGRREFVSTQAGREQRQSLPPIAGDWLTPAALGREVEAQMAQGAKQITVRTLDLSAGAEPLDITLSVLGEEQVEVFGRVAPAVVWEASIAQLPGMKTREYVDAQGRTLKSTSTLIPGMDITLLAADEQLAMSPVDPPEILAALFITPDKPIANPRQQRQLTYQIRLAEGSLAQDGALPSTGAQQVEWMNDREARVRVDLDGTVPTDDAPDASHRGASSMIDPADPKIIELVNEALGDDGQALPAPQKAQRLRAFVFDYIQAKDLSVGMGSASEVARTRQGDCTEHAVLLAAMLRAAEIPSRTATGLIYVEEFLGHRGVFGGHMWTQAWLPGAADDAGRWVDLDATLHNVAFDAAHIALGVSAMAEGQMTNDMVAMAPLLGKLNVQVLDTAAEPAPVQR